jgi:DNA polymerase
MVFGDGNAHAKIMLVGEQPGDEEDKQGVPFVGPAGKLLDRALEAAGVERKLLYVTNAVKHFKWQLRVVGSRVSGFNDAWQVC